MSMPTRCIILAVAMLASSVALAEPVPDLCNEFPQFRGTITGFIVDGDDATFELPVNPHITTVVEFSSEVTDYSAPSGLAARHAAYPWSMTIIPTASSSGTMDFETRSHTVHFTIRLVDDPTEAISRAIVWQRTKEDAGKPAVQALGQIVCSGDEIPPPKTPAVIPGADNAVTERVIDESVCDLLNDRGTVVRLHDRLPGEQTVGILATQYVRLGAKGYLKLELINREVVPFTIGTVQIFDHNRKRIAPSAIRIRAPGEHSSELMGIIPARNSVVGTIAISDADLLTESFSLMVSEPNGGRTIWREGIRLGDLSPSPTAGDTIKLYTRPDGVDVWEFNPPDDNEGRMSISMQVIGGVIWVGDGLGIGKLAPTSLRGLGARLTYGLSKHFNFEAEVMGADSDEACFKDVTYNGMQGELVRSGASFGRIQAGGALRFGKEYIPYVRLGLGVQGMTGSGGELVMPDGDRMPGLESTFELDGIWSIGGGLDIRIGEYFSAGIAASFEKLVSTSARALEANMHFSYAWKQ